MLRWFVAIGTVYIYIYIYTQKGPIKYLRLRPLKALIRLWGSRLYYVLTYWIIYSTEFQAGGLTFFAVHVYAYTAR